MTNLEGAVVVVTGGAMGIGQASAVAFGQAGAEAVVVADIDEQAAEDTLGAIEATGARGVFVRTDVRDHQQVAHVLDEAVRQFGHLDVLHNNAGVVSGDPAWPATSVERIEHVVRVNLLGVMFGTRLGIERIAASGGGAIVNTSSIAGLYPTPQDAVYSATKAAIIMFTQSCAEVAVSHGVRVNAVLPSSTDTSIIAKTGDGVRPAAWLAALLTPDMLLPPERVAAAVVELAASAQSGQSVIVENAA